MSNHMEFCQIGFGEPRNSDRHRQGFRDYSRCVDLLEIADAERGDPDSLIDGCFDESFTFE